MHRPVAKDRPWLRSGNQEIPPKNERSYYANYGLFNIKNYFYFFDFTTFKRLGQRLRKKNCSFFGGTEIS